MGFLKRRLCSSLDKDGWDAIAGSCIQVFEKVPKVPSSFFVKGQVGRH